MFLLSSWICMFDGCESVKNTWNYLPHYSVTLIICSLHCSQCDPWKTHLSCNILQCFLITVGYSLNSLSQKDLPNLPCILLWLHFYRSPSSALILLHFSNTCHSRTRYSVLSLSVGLFFLIFAYVLQWPPSYFPSSHPPCILGIELPDIFLNNLCFFHLVFITHSLLDFKSYWDQGSCLSCPPLNLQCLKEA